MCRPTLFGCLIVLTLVYSSLAQPPEAAQRDAAVAARNRCMAFDRVIDSSRLAVEIWIVCHGNDSGVLRRPPMQGNVLSAIARESRTPKLRRELKLVRILQTLICPAGFEGCHDIMAKPPEPFDNGERKVLVCIEHRHAAQASSFRRIASSISARWDAE